MKQRYIELTTEKIESNPPKTPRKRIKSKRESPPDTLPNQKNPVHPQRLSLSDTLKYHAEQTESFVKKNVGHRHQET
jgi:hypothetical protein